MRNFTGNPFLMVSERSGNAKLIKTSKNPFFGEIIDILEVVESRSTPNPTVVLNRNINVDNRAMKLTQCSRIVPLLHGLPDGHCSMVQYRMQTLHSARG